MLSLDAAVLENTLFCVPKGFLLVCAATSISKERNGADVYRHSGEWRERIELRTKKRKIKEERGCFQCGDPYLFQVFQS